MLAEMLRMIVPANATMQVHVKMKNNANKNNAFRYICMRWVFLPGRNSIHIKVRKLAYRLWIQPFKC